MALVVDIMHGHGLVTNTHPQLQPNKTKVRICKAAMVGKGVGTFSEVGGLRCKMLKCMPMLCKAHMLACKVCQI